jgi:hypothetical protein
MAFLKWVVFRVVIYPQKCGIHPLIDQLRLPFSKIWQNFRFFRNDASKLSLKVISFAV